MPTFAEAAASGYTPSEEERQHAFLSHLLAAIANVVFLGLLLPVVAPLGVLLITKDREKKPFLLFHLNQSIAFQAALFAINVAIAVLVTVLTLATCGAAAILYFLNGIPPLVGLLYGLTVGFGAKWGQWQRYPVVGDRIFNTQKPLVS